MQLNIIDNAKRNIFFGFINKFIVMLCPFIVRTVIIYKLGNEYLGLDSLFTSILTVLSLSEMGFSSAVVYNMYKPIADGDTKQINALLHFYRKAYRFIGFFILLIGLSIIPFLPKLIKGSHPQDINLMWLYLIYLIDTVLSYFLYAYLTSILTAFQRNDINSRISSFISIILTIFKVIIIITTRNYYLYAIILPLATIANNLFVARAVKKYFPAYRCEGELSSKTTQNIRKVVAGTFIQKACETTRNSLDSIFISAFIGLSLTGIYNNYYLIARSITATMGIIANSFSGGIGNRVATKSSKENFDELLKLDFVYLWLGGWCSICLLCLYQPFMKFWVGEVNMLPISSVILLVIYFYLLKLGDMKSLYNAANGLWWEHKWRSIVETISNVVLNYTLAKMMGINGIILATIISLFICNYLWGTKILFKSYFDNDMYLSFLKKQFFYSVTTCIVAYLTYNICININYNNIYYDFFCRVIICLFVPNILFYAIYRKNDIYKQAICLIRNRI